MNNLVFYTYYQKLYALIADKPNITKQVMDMYIKRIRLPTDMHRNYIKLHGVKNVDWHTGTYHMEPHDINKIIKDWKEEWKSSTVDLTDSDEDPPKEKYKGKEKLSEKKDKECTRENRKTPQDNLNPHKRTKVKSRKPPTCWSIGFI